jgi:hypothetical protein
MFQPLQGHLQGALNYIHFTSNFLSAITCFMLYSLCFLVQTGSGPLTFIQLGFKNSSSYILLSLACTFAWRLINGEKFYSKGAILLRAILNHHSQSPSQYVGSRYNVGHTVPRLSARWPRNWGLIPDVSMVYFSSRKYPHRLWARVLFPREQSGRGMKTTTHLNLLQKSRMSGVIPPYPHVFMAHTGANLPLPLPLDVCVIHVL